MIMVHLLSMVLFLACLTIQCVQAQERYITSEDITSHPSYSASLPYFLKIESEMYRIKERASFHSFVHIIPPVLELIKAVTVLEIGMFGFSFVISDMSVFQLIRSNVSRVLLRSILNFGALYPFSSKDCFIRPESSPASGYSRDYCEKCRKIQYTWSHVSSIDRRLP
jgi:hypothetical protein